MKKVFSGILILLMLLSFAACGGDDKNTDVSQNGESFDAPYIEKNDEALESEDSNAENSKKSESENSNSSKDKKPNNKDEVKSEKSKINGSSSAASKENKNKSSKAGNSNASSKDKSSKTSSSNSSSKITPQKSESSKNETSKNNSLNVVFQNENEGSQTETSKSESFDETEPPEKVTKVYKFKELGVTPKPLKSVFYDTENGNTLPYCLYLPDDYSASEKYPVILYLHGAGALGNDNTRQTDSLNKAFKENSDFVSQVIIICPQTDVWWALDRDYQGDRNGTLTSAMNLLSEIQGKYSCDSNRLYVTGVSMGGYATWDLLVRHGSTFAAAAPICGVGDESQGEALKDIPIRIYHGTADPTVSFDASQRMYNAIKNVGGTMVELYALDGVEHNAWDYAYGDRDFFAWLLAQNKARYGAEEYKTVNRFEIVDYKGNVVIDESDITGIGSFENSGSVDVEMTVSEYGKERLKKAYTNSQGKEFTVYCMSQKIYSFTATKEPIDNLFTIRGVFDDDNFVGFYQIIQRVCLKIT